MTAAAARPAATATRPLRRAGPPPSPRAGASFGSDAGLGKPWESNIPAWLSTAPRCAIASGSCPTASARVSALGQRVAPAAARRLSAAAADSASPGDSPSSRAGCSSRSRRVEQVTQRPRCRCSCSRSATVSCPSQPASIPLSTRQSRRPARATTSAAREAPRCSRAREVSAFARVRGTPTTDATSATARPCRNSSSMTSRSPGVRPVVASSSRPRSLARSVSSCTLGAPAITNCAWADANVNSGRPGRAIRWHSLRATAYSQALSRSGSRRSASLAAAMTNVSCTASAASAGSPSDARQYL